MNLIFFGSQKLFINRSKVINNIVSKFKFVSNLIMSFYEYFFLEIYENHCILVLIFFLTFDQSEVSKIFA